MTQRLYKPESAWAVWRWTYTPSGYITRLHLLKTPWGAVMLHWINGPDPEPDMHDHPVTFLSLIVWGWYVERRNGVYRQIRDWNFIRATHKDTHQITSVSPGGALTLCFVGPKVREWGFHTRQQWVHWKHYNAEKYGLSATVEADAGVRGPHIARFINQELKRVCAERDRVLGC